MRAALGSRCSLLQGRACPPIIRSRRVAQVTCAAEPQVPSAPTFVRIGAPLPDPLSWGNAVCLVDKCMPSTIRPSADKPGPAQPKEWTSQDVCAKLRGILRYTGVSKKVGHAGTLDPLATGLLIVCVGKATKMVDSFMAQRKRYTGTFKLGEYTPSYDADCEVTERSEWAHITDAQLASASGSFLGDILQVPPMYSAIKKGGVKLYDMARQGVEIEREPRPVTIYRFDVSRSEPGSQFVQFDVECSKGTYIRSLAHDLGQKVGTHAHLTALRREAIGDYQVTAAWPLEELARAAQEQRTRVEAAGGGAAPSGSRIQQGRQQGGGGARVGASSRARTARVGDARAGGGGGAAAHQKSSGGTTAAAEAPPPPGSTGG